MPIAFATMADWQETMAELEETKEMATLPVGTHKTSNVYGEARFPVSMELAILMRQYINVIRPLVPNVKSGPDDPIFVVWKHSEMPGEDSRRLRQGLQGKEVAKRMWASFGTCLGEKQWIKKASPTAVRKVVCTLLRPKLTPAQQQLLSRAMSHSNEMAERVYQQRLIEDVKQAGTLIDTLWAGNADEPMPEKRDEPQPEKPDEPVPEKRDEPQPEKADEPVPEKPDEPLPEANLPDVIDRDDLELLVKNNTLFSEREFLAIFSVFTEAINERVVPMKAEVEASMARQRMKRLAMIKGDNRRSQPLTVQQIRDKLKTVIRQMNRLLLGKVLPDDLNLLRQ